MSYIKINYQSKVFKKGYVTAAFTDGKVVEAEERAVLVLVHAVLPNILGRF